VLAAVGVDVPWCDHQFVATPTIPICALCGQSPTSSPSQLEQWIGCRRKHAYNRSRARTPSGPAAYFGTQCHTACENWLNDRTPPDPTTPVGRTVLPALALLPLPQTPGMIVEATARPNLLGVQWHMRVDLVHGYIPGVVVCVDDHKTTGDIHKNAKDAQTLSTTDPQGIAYTHWAAETFDVPLVVGTWRYMQRDAKAKPRPVIFTITRTDAAKRFARMHVDYVLPMVRSRVLPPEALPRDGLENGFCSAFGKCDHLDECHATLTPHERAKAALVQLRKAAPP
jgi:hypothetical protein